MTRVAKWIMRLYPAAWRGRYGDEMDALLADTGADARVVADLAKGGIRMQMKAWSFPVLAMTLGTAGAVAGAVIGLLLPSQYTSRATLQITSARISRGESGAALKVQLNELIQRAEIHIFSRTALNKLMQESRPRLYDVELKTTPLEDVIEKMKQNISVQFATLPGDLDRRAAAFDITFTYPDRLQAQETIEALIKQFRSELQDKPDPTPHGAPNSTGLTLIDPASLPVLPIYPERLLAILAGFVSGVLLASVWRLAHQTGFIARRFLPVALAFGLVGLAAITVADYVFHILPYQYRSTATVQLPPGASPDQVSAVQNAVFSHAGLSVVMMNPRLDLYKEIRRNTPLQSVIDNMKRHLKVTRFPSSDPTSFTISFDYPNRYKAQQTVMTLINRLIGTYQQFYPNPALPAPDVPLVVDVRDWPSRPVTPSSPNPRMIALAGALRGVIAAALIALVRRRWKPETQIPEANA